MIEPVLKVYRAYRFASNLPQCDKYVLCMANSHDPEETLSLANLKIGITKISSAATAWFLSNQNGTPFWTLLNIVLEPQNCEVSVDLSIFFNVFYVKL